MTLLGPIDHVYYWASDMDRSVRFYQEVLGLPVAARYEDRWAELDGGSIRLALHGTKDREAVPSGGGGVVAFRVGDLDATKAILRERGVDVVHEGEVEGYGRFALFPDPDGNVLEIVEHAEEGA